jgi:hypothetical protein
MNFPGFAAEASLFKTTGRYRSGAAIRRNGAISPANGFVFFDPVGDSLDYDDIDRGPIYGIVKGEIMETKFESCMQSCQAGRHTYADCQRTCCQQVTGKSTCVIA